MTHLSEHDLDAIEARIRDCKTYNFGLWNADKLAHEDAPAMLTELRHLRVIASGNQGAIVNSIIERTRTETADEMLPGPSDAAKTHLGEWRERRNTHADDEREARRIAELDARQAAYRKEREDWYVDHEAEPEIASNAFFRGWDAAVGAGFRRSEVREPSAEDIRRATLAAVKDRCACGLPVDAPRHKAVLRSAGGAR